MFGGKPLSAWYEEERRRHSMGHTEEEAKRGRARERVYYPGRQPRKHHSTASKKSKHWRAAVIRP